MSGGVESLQGISGLLGVHGEEHTLQRKEDHGTECEYQNTVQWLLCSRWLHLAIYSLQ